MEDEILKKLEHIKRLIENQSLLQKSVLNFKEACTYLEFSQSHLYKLTSTKQIPHFIPNGKKIYFKREELDLWLLRNKQVSCEEIEKQANDYLIKNKR